MSETKRKKTPKTTDRNGKSSHSEDTRRKRPGRTYTPDGRKHERPKGRALGGGRGVRAVLRNAAVGQSVLDAIDKQQADKLVIDDLKDELMELRDVPPTPISQGTVITICTSESNDSNGSPKDPSVLSALTVSDTGSDNLNGGLTCNEPTSVEEDVFATYVRAHYAAFGYNDKTHTSARSSIIKWRHISKTKRSFDACLSYVDEEYLGRKDSFPFLSRCRASFQTWWYEKATWKHVAGLLAGTTLAIGLVMKHKKTRSILACATIGVVGFMLQRKDVHFRTRSVKGIKTYCTQMDPNVNHTIDDGAKITIPDVTRQKCVAKTVPVGFSFGINYIWVPRNCFHNEYNALVTRQLQKRLPITDAGIGALDTALKVLQEHLGPVVNPWSKEEEKTFFLAKYPLKRRTQIEKSMATTLIIDTRVAGFPKIEVMTGKPCSSRKVRFISGFDDGYLAETGPEYYMWQKNLIKHYWSDPINRQFQKFLYTGGLMADEIGDWFGQQIREGRVLVLLDFSKFDSRNKTAILERLMSFYGKHLSPELMLQLQATFNKLGRTSHGIKFCVEATVASGRIDTSLGNTLIVFMLVIAMMAMMSHRYVEDTRVSALGDDNNSSLTSFYHTMDDIKRVSGYLGHEADGMIIRPGEYHKIEYCSQRLWEYSPGQYVLGPKIGRLLAKTFVCHKHVPDNQLVDHVAGVVQGFKNYRWLPLFRAVYARWEQLHPAPGKLYYSDSNPYKMQLRTTLEVDPDCIQQQFLDVYGFDPDLLEQEMLNLSYNMGDTYSHPLMDRVLEEDGVSYTYEVADYCEYLTQKTEGPVSDYVLRHFH